jgi:membrane protein DedA with SNARE-associated domain
MSVWQACLSAFVGGMAGGAWAYWAGYRRGIRDTEARWSEAVGRSDDARRRGNVS